MNLKCGFRRVTLVFAVLVGIICGGTAIGMLIYERNSALRHLDKCEKEFIGSVPVAGPNERPAGWPEWSSESSYSDYLQELSTYLFLKQLNLPWVPLEEEKKYKEEHEIPQDRRGPFLTEEGMKFMRTYGKCIEKARLLMVARSSFGAGLSTSEIVLIGLGCAIAGFCGIWLVYGIIGCLVVPLVFWVSKGFRKDTG